MEGLGVILFLIAIVASLFDQSRKPKGTGTPPAPRRRPPVARPPRPIERRPEAARLPRTEPESEGSAADMIPEDFWAELTGRARPAPPPETLPPQDLPSWDEEAVARAEEQSRERERLQPEALDAYRRPEVVREPTRVVSLETPPPPPELRHAAFHRRLEKQARAAAAAAAEAVPAEPVPGLRARLRNREALRESFVLQEVFGPPKGLDP